MESALSINRKLECGGHMKNRLEELRKQRGIRQEELAAALEVSRQTIGSLENGRYNPSILLAFKIARYFDVSIEEIFIYEEESI
jgi:putative transcriptional regulator